MTSEDARVLLVIYSSLALFAVVGAVRMGKGGDSFLDYLLGAVLGIAAWVILLGLLQLVAVLLFLASVAFP